MAYDKKIRKYLLLFLVLGWGVSLAYLFFMRQPNLRRAEKKEGCQAQLQNADSESRKALAFLRKRDDARALLIFDKMLKTDPDNPDYLWGKAEVLRRSRDYASARDCFQQILKRNPKHLPSLVSLAYLDYHDNCLDPAKELIEKVLAEKGADKDDLALAYLMLGSINSRQLKGAGLINKIRRTTQVREAFLKARGLAPELPETHLALGTFYLLAPAIMGGNLNKAVKELEESVKIAPQFATACARLAQAYRRKGLIQEYAFYLSRAESLDKQNEVLQEMRQSNKSGLYQDNRILMGTFFEVISPDKRAAQIVFDETERLEGLLSKYRQTSEIYLLNKYGKLKVSRDTFYVIKEAKRFYKLSAGAFDISVARLSEIWGFSDQKYRLPSENEIKDALRLTGADKIILHEADNVVEFKNPGMKIDLGGIAKGYALDCAVKKLKENNINSCLISAGGQLYCLGEKSAHPWRVAIRKARKEEAGAYLELKDKSVSTSGDYQQFFVAGNRRYCHILNPKTGYPAESGITSVSVISQSALEADALSTAIFVLGKNGSRELLAKFPAVETRICEE